MMDKEKISKEFIFIREKLTEIAKQLVEENYRSASFSVGCLHSIVHYLSIDVLKEK
jgi:hypothetical protein